MDPRRSHKGLAMLISRISLRISGATVGPATTARDFHRQYDLKPARVPFNHGLRLHDREAPSTFGAKRYKPANIRRSTSPNVDRFGDCRHPTR